MTFGPAAPWAASKAEEPMKNDTTLGESSWRPPPRSRDPFHARLPLDASSIYADLAASRRRTDAMGGRRGTTLGRATRTWSRDADRGV